MAVVEMSGLTFVGPKKEVISIGRKLLLRGTFQPVPIDMAVPDRDIRSSLQTSAGNPWAELLSEMDSLWRMSGEKVPEPGVPDTKKLLSLEEAGGRIGRISKRLRIWQQRAKDLAEEEEQLEATKVYAEALADSDIKVSEALDTRILRIFTGKLSLENYQSLEDASGELPLLVIPLKKIKNNIWIMVLTVSGYLEGAKKLLDSVYFRDFPVKNVETDTGSDWIDDLGRRIERHRRAIATLRDTTARYLAKNREELTDLYSRVYLMKGVYDICRKRGEITDLFVVSGWVPGSEVEILKETVERDAPKTIIISESSTGAQGQAVSSRIPVLLRNMPLVRYFQDVVALYSLPAYDEKDPSLFVAFTFCLFFGFMFGDVGHGIMLLAGSFLLVKKNVLSRSFGSVLNIAGLSSVIFGFLYGSVFGNEDIIRGIWLSPLEDMNRLIQASLVLGISVISVGMLLNISLQYRKKAWGKLLFDARGAAGLLLYWFAVVAAWVSLTDRSLPFSFLLLTVPLAVLTGVILFSEQLARYLLHEEGEGESAIVHVFHVLHSLLSFLSNTVSFVRLAAFALNHVGLSLAVLMLSRMVEGLPAGSVLTWIILIMGHLVIVSLEGLIVFIQTLRLEYYEFFSKFYTGGGKPFSPVTWEGGKRGRSL